MSRITLDLPAFSVRDDTLCEYLRLPTSKEMNKIVDKLRRDGLLKTDIRSESRSSESQSRIMQQSTISLDYKRFIDVVKYRMLIMQRKISEMASNVRGRCFLYLWVIIP